MAKTRRTDRASRGRRIDPDAAIIALVIAAIDSSGHVSAIEGERAHHLVWSMRRFRNRSADTVGAMIERAKAEISARGAAAVIGEAARVTPAPLRRAVFAVAIDLVLADARMERLERRFVMRLASDLRLTAAAADEIVRVMKVKNAL